MIRAAADDEAEIIFGTSIDEALGRDVAITLIATGFQGARSARQRGVDRRPAAVRQPVSLSPRPRDPPEVTHA